MDEGLIRGEDKRVRCAWPGGDPLYLAYHDAEWGRPTADETRLFEKLCLEGFQSGLSWITILRKRENFRAAFAGFDVEALARFGAKDVERLLGDAGIVRHRGKIESVLNNARKAIALKEEAGSIAEFVWRYVPEPRTRPKRFDLAALRSMTTSPESVALSKALRKRGWSFVGPTTVYSFMQAMGLVNDHIHGCFARKECEAAQRNFVRP